MPEALLFLLRVVILVLLWGLVAAAVVAVRHDVFGARPARQPAGAPPPRPVRRAPPRAERRGGSQARRLVVTDGPLAGTSLPLGDAPVTIGRADDSTLVLTDDYVSTRHARLLPRDDAWVVEDLGSTNGTFLGQQKVSEPTPVPLRTPVRVGRTILELRA